MAGNWSKCITYTVLNCTVANPTVDLGVASSIPFRFDSLVEMVHVHVIISTAIYLLPLLNDGLSAYPSLLV